MNIDEIIDEFRACSDRINSALEESDNPNGDNKAWLMCAIAAYYKAYVSEVDPAISDNREYRQEAFFQVIEKALKAMKNGDSPEQFYSVFYSESQPRNMDGIKQLAENFCSMHGVKWEQISSSLKQGQVDSVDGYISDFIKILIEKRDAINSALEERTDDTSRSSDELSNWYYAIFASYCSTPEAVSSFISETMGKYIDRWHIDGTDEYFPYSMDKTSHTAHQKGNPYWDNTIEPKRKKYDEEFIEKANTKRYMKWNNEPKLILQNGYTDKNKLDSEGEYVKLYGIDVYLNARELDCVYSKEGDEYKENYDFQHYSSRAVFSSSKGGKGSPELMNYTIAGLKKDNIIKTKDKMAYYGLGIDCSGFVSRAIVDLMIALRIPIWKQIDTMGIGFGRIRTNATVLRDEGSQRLFYYKTDYKFVGDAIDIEPDKKSFPGCFKPGDIMMRKEVEHHENGKYTTMEDNFHILIVKEVTPDSIEIWNSASDDSIGPCSYIFDNIDGLKRKYKLDKESQKKLNLKPNHEIIVEFARPKIFNDIKELIPYYLNYLERGEDYVVPKPVCCIEKNP